MSGSRDPYADTDATRAARAEMVQTQLVARGIADPLVLEAMRRVPRHAFVDPPLAAHAYDDVALPGACGQTISQPYIVGLMTEALRLEPSDRVLEIGTGTGYQAAVLATMGVSVCTVERLPDLARDAEVRLDALGFGGRVRVLVADGSRAWPAGGRFEGIVVTAAAPEAPASLLAALAPGGRLVIPLGERRAQHLVRLLDTPEGLRCERLVACTFVPLIGEEAWPE